MKQSEIIRQDIEKKHKELDYVLKKEQEEELRKQLEIEYTVEQALDMVTKEKSNCPFNVGDVVESTNPEINEKVLILFKAPGHTFYFTLRTAGKRFKPGRIYNTGLVPMAWNKFALVK